MKSQNGYPIAAPPVSLTRKILGAGSTASLFTGIVAAGYLSIFPSESHQAVAKPVAPINQEMSSSNLDAQVAAMHELVQQRSATPKIVTPCSAFKDVLPDNYVLYAGGSYSGRKLGYQIDQSGHEATGFEVSVNLPGQSVVLALGAYEPSVWNIHKSAGTHILGVLVSGYHRQQIKGIDPNTPVLNSTYEDKSPCGYFYVSEDVRQADETLRTMLGKSPVSYHLAANGKLNFGPSLIADMPEMDYPLAGKAGLDALESKGVIRPAGEEDLARYHEAKRQAQGLPPIVVVGGSTSQSSSGNLRRGLLAYVVLKPMRFPGGLHGAHAVTFIIERGVPRPQGEPGHSAVYDLNSLTCAGPMCN